MDTDIACPKNEIPRQTSTRQVLKRLPRQTCHDQNDPRYQKQPPHAHPLAPNAQPSPRIARVVLAKTPASSRTS